MRFAETIYIPASRAELIDGYLNREPENEDECLGEDSPITETIRFSNGMQMDVKCCGVQYRDGESNTAWCEAVLFDPFGFEVGHSEVEEEFLGDWELEDGAGNTYVGTVEVGKNTILNYRYIATGNYKVHNSATLRGEMTEEQFQEICECLDVDTDQSFIPQQVGLPADRGESIAPEDGPWFDIELDYGEAVELVDESAPVGAISVEELVEKFKQAKAVGWGCM